MEQSRGRFKRHIGESRTSFSDAPSARPSTDVFQATLSGTMTDVRQKKLRLKDLHREKELGDASDMSEGSLKDLKPSLWTLGKVVLTAPAAILSHAIKSRNAQVNPSMVTHLNSLADLSEIQKAIERLVTCAIG